MLFVKGFRLLPNQGLINRNMIRMAKENSKMITRHKNKRIENSVISKIYENENVYVYNPG